MRENQAQPAGSQGGTNCECLGARSRAHESQDRYVRARNQKYKPDRGKENRQSFPLILHQEGLQRLRDERALARGRGINGTILARQTVQLILGLLA